MIYKPWVSDTSLFCSVPRPFRVPVGKVGCFFLLFPPIAGIFIIMVLASPTTLLFSLGINISGILIYYCYRGKEAAKKYTIVPGENSTPPVVEGELS